uniref:Uncharacterized protein n=1 Tax=Arion vulgaris TaxID=1028688 RepID=A0A0B7AZT7_9EUPU
MLYPYLSFSTSEFSLSGFVYYFPSSRWIVSQDYHAPHALIFDKVYSLTQVLQGWVPRECP